MAPRGRLSIVFARATGAFLLFAAFSGRAEEVLRVSGTGTALGAMRRLSGAFEKANPGHRVVVLPSVGSSGAVKAVAHGALDVGLSGRPLGPEEQALGLVASPYARTPFVFAVGPRSGITAITARELVRIYRGELQTWPSGERVRVVLRPRTDLDDRIVRSISANVAAAVEVAHGREGMLTAISNQECEEILTHTPGSIGPTTLTQLRTEGDTLTPLAWEGAAPTVSNLASGAYPLVKTLLVVTRTSPSPAIRRFLDFLGSPEARKILEQTGNIPVPPRRLD